MYINRKIIYDFCNRVLGMSKRDIAKKINRHESNFAPSRSYNSDDLFDAVFKTDSEERRSFLLNQLKNFFDENEIKDDFRYVWKMTYEESVKAILLKANVDPLNSKIFDEQNTGIQMGHNFIPNIQDSLCLVIPDGGAVRSELREIFDQNYAEIIFDRASSEISELFFQAYYEMDSDSKNSELSHRASVEELLLFLRTIEQRIFVVINHRQIYLSMSEKLSEFSRVLRDFIESSRFGFSTNFGGYASVQSDIDCHQRKLLSLISEICSNEN